MYKKSTVPFERWVSRERSTWPFQVFQQYNDELSRLLVAQRGCSKYTYSALGKAGAKWEDPAAAHLTALPIQKKTKVDTLRDWSDQFHAFENWTRLNTIVAITSNLETYISAVVRLAIESDPGVLIGAPRAIDGLSFLKKSSHPLQIDDAITACTKGEWAARILAYHKLFGKIPPILERKGSDLDDVRRIRNRVGHAFGRDIDASRQHGVRGIIPIELISEERSIRYQRLLWSTAKSIDFHLLHDHIGEYQALRFYHNLRPTLRDDIHPSQRAMIFKKQLGRFKALIPGKQFAKELVTYYEKN